MLIVILSHTAYVSASTGRRVPASVSERALIGRGARVSRYVSAAAETRQSIARQPYDGRCKWWKIRTQIGHSTRVCVAAFAAVAASVGAITALCIRIRIIGTVVTAVL